MSAEIIYGVDFPAKRRRTELEQLAVAILGDITVYGFDFDPIAQRHEIDTAPCEYLPTGPWTDGAA